MAENPFAREPKAITDSLFTLEEPWRERFLAFVARQAKGHTWSGPSPSRDQVTSWLGRDGLRDTVTMMLGEWHGMPITEEVA